MKLEKDKSIVVYADGIVLGYIEVNGYWVKTSYGDSWSGRGVEPWDEITVPIAKIISSNSERIAEEILKGSVEIVLVQEPKKKFL